jgi:hypothetical protein
MKSSLFLDVVQLWLVVSYRLFGFNCCPETSETLPTDVVCNITEDQSPQQTFTSTNFFNNVGQPVNALPMHLPYGVINAHNKVFLTLIFSALHLLNEHLVSFHHWT